jgi:hypothetical protein
MKKLMHYFLIFSLCVMDISIHAADSNASKTNTASASSDDSGFSENDRNTTILFASIIGAIVVVGTGRWLWKNGVREWVQEKLSAREAAKVSALKDKIIKDLQKPEVLDQIKNSSEFSDLLSAQTPEEFKAAIEVLAPKLGTNSSSLEAALQKIEGFEKFYENSNLTATDNLPVDTEALVTIMKKLGLTSSADALSAMELDKELNTPEIALDPVGDDEPQYDDEQEYDEQEYEGEAQELPDQQPVYDEQLGSYEPPDTSHPVDVPLSNPAELPG